MGYFTWTFADKKSRKNNYGMFADSCKLVYRNHGWLYCPSGELVFEQNYHGYGMFGGNDVFELVVDWNREYLKDIFKKLDQKDPGGFHKTYSAIASFYQDHNKSGISEEACRLGRDWKRELGIAIACVYNRSLPFPIKIVSTANPGKSYKDLPASKQCQ